MAANIHENASGFPIRAGRILILLLLGLTLSSCAFNRASVAVPEASVESGWSIRAISEQEIDRQSSRDSRLDSTACREILARLNGKDIDYISSDIKKGSRLKVPKDFRYYITWSPLPETLPQARDIPKLILVSKDVPFIAWYTKGRKTGDCYICVGKKREWTKTGMYNVLEKDIDHVSRSYRSALGYPAFMPFALRVYGYVWIHGGDVIGGYCSHGCINLPLGPAESLFNWADKGTLVLIVESVKELDMNNSLHPRLARSKKQGKA